MASPMPTRKSTVDLTKGAVRLSRIRRAPPPPPEKLLTREQLRRREAWGMAVGIGTFAVLLFVILFTLGIGPGWTPGDATIVIRNW